MMRGTDDIAITIAIGCKCAKNHTCDPKVKTLQIIANCPPHSPDEKLNHIDYDKLI